MKIAKKKKPSKLARQKSKPSSRYWLKQADKLWSEVVRLPGQCAICGKSEFLNAHHLIDRSVKIFRHTIINSIPLCPKCHKYDRRLSAHKSGIVFSYWLSINYPEKYKWVIEHYMDADIDSPNYKLAFENLQKILKDKGLKDTKKE